MPRLAALKPFDMRAWRDMRGYTQDLIADELGTSPQRIGRMEKRGTVSMEFLYALKGWEQVYLERESKTINPLGAAV